MRGLNQLHEEAVDFGHFGFGLITRVANPEVQPLQMRHHFVKLFAHGAFLYR